mmetsp:Transcript_45848/g.73360  ORF Transcript_45848/g.73360 Transcript_45848/m.73360 type:complete len:217 (-) Transcript_45848:14-664(-)
MTLAYLRAASRASASVLAPVHTILPELKMSAVVLGARMRMIAAAKRLGLYSTLRAWKAMVLRSSLQSRLTVATMFWSMGTIPEGCTLRSTVPSSGADDGPPTVVTAVASGSTASGGPGASAVVSMLNPFFHPHLLSFVQTTLVRTFTPKKIPRREGRPPRWGARGGAEPRGTYCSPGVYTGKDRVAPQHRRERGGNGGCQAAGVTAAARVNCELRE